jgi:hypothetical protein
VPSPRKYGYGTHARPKTLGLGTHPSPKRLVLAVCQAQDNTGLTRMSDSSTTWQTTKSKIMVILPWDVQGNDRPSLSVTSWKNLVFVGLATLDVLKFNFLISF